MRRAATIGLLLAAAASRAGAADLSGTVSSPGTAVAGGTLAITTKVTATGGSVKAFTIALYLSTDSTITTADRLVGSRSVSGLAKGASSTATTTVTVPSSLVGVHYVGAIFDSGNAIAESNESNNAVAGNTVTIAGPDLTFNALSSAPLEVLPGDSIALTDTVFCTGAPVGTFYVYYYLVPLPTGPEPWPPPNEPQLVAGEIIVEPLDTYLGYRIVNGLAAGASSTATTTFALPAVEAGGYQVRAVADASGLVAESNELNNEIWGNLFQVLPPDIWLTSVVAQPTAVARGGTIQVTDTVTAQGAVGFFYVYYYLSDDPTITPFDTYVGWRAVNGLASGQSSTGTTSIDIPAHLGGTLWVGAIADVDAFVTESDEANNALLGNAVEILKPDLTVASVAATPPDPLRGGTIEVTDTVAVAGGSVSGFYVYYYLSTDEIITPDDAYVGWRHVSGLSSGQSSTGTTSITLPAYYAGRYHVGAIADVDGFIPESDETNNARTGNAIEFRKPDLTLASVSATPSTILSGGTIEVTDTVAVAGGAVSGFYVYYYLSTDESITSGDAYVGWRYVSGLASGESSTGTTSIAIPSYHVGTFYVGAIADGSAIVAESVETNNARAGNAVVIGQPRPDLVVSTVTAPAQVEAGGALAVSSTVTAWGSGTTAGFLVDHYLSADATITAQDVRVGTAWVPALGPGESGTASTAFILPAAMEGSWWVGAIVDVDGTIPESDEGNNAVAGNLVQILRPDLRVAEVSAAPNPVSVGGTLTITSTVAAGDVAAWGNTWVRFYLSADAALSPDDAYLGARQVPSLPALGTSTGTVAVGLPASAAGTYHVVAIADADDTLNESDETNNALASDPLAIPPPDLTATVTASITPIRVGGTIGVSSTVTAAGGGTAIPFWVRFYLSSDEAITADDLLLGARQVSSLAAGASAWVGMAVSLPPEAKGSYRLGVILDGEQAVPESNEENNWAATPLEILDPDLTVVSISGSPNPVAAGGTLDVSSTVKLTGGTTEIGFWVRHYLSLDAAITTDDVFIGAWWVSSLIAGMTTSNTTSVTLPEAVAGTYYLGTIVDADGALAESDETNNARVGPRLQIGPDLEPPLILVTGATDGLVTAEVPLLVCFDAIDPNLASVEGALDGVPFAGCTSVFLEGDHELVVQAADTFGNAATRTVAFAVDLTPPRIAISGVEDGTVSNAASLTPVYSASDPHLASVSATLDGAPFQSGTPVFAEGDHVLSVTAADLAGNAATAHVSFALDRTPPQVAISGVADGMVSNAASLTPTFSASDPHLASVTATLDGAPFASGTPVSAEGDHVLSVTAADLAGNVATVQVSFALDRTPPAISFTGVSEGAVYSGPVAPGVSVVDAHPGTLSVTLDGMPYQPGTPIGAEGSHVFAATATDAAGNASSAQVSFAIDLTFPRIEVTGVADGLVSSAPSLTPVFSATDATLASATATLDGAPFESGTPVSAEGDHVLFVTATDLAGNVATVQISFALDRIAPEVTISGVADGTVSSAPSLTPIFTVTDAHLGPVSATLDGAPFESGTPVSAEADHVLAVSATDLAGNGATAQVSFALDRTAPAITFAGVTEGAVLGNAVAPDVIVTDAHPGTLSLTLDGAPYLLGTTIEAEGDHVLVATAVDAAGNSSTAPLTFAIDRTPPAVAIASPADGSVTASPSVEVVVTATDARGVALVTVNGITVPAGADGRYRTTLALSEGPNPVEATARDVAGNGAGASATVRRDSTEPVLLVTEPAEGATLGSGAVAVSGTVSDASAVTLTVAGEPVALAADGSFHTTVQVGAGPQSIPVVATDEAGNASTVVRNVTVSAQPPTLVVSEPQPGFVTTRSQIPVRGTATSNGGGAVAVTVNGAAVALGADGSFSTSVEAPAGAVTITVVATDASGRSTTVAVTGQNGEAPPGEPPPSGSLVVRVDAPADGAILGSGIVAVTGHVEGATLPVQVTVAGVPAAVSSTWFNVGLALVEGDHTLVVRATDAAGQVALAERRVSIDHTPPYLSVTRPATSPAVATESPYLVQGTVGDLNLSTVTVGGQPATVLAGQFSRAVPLQVGNNTVAVEARDFAGNVTSRSIVLSVAALPPLVTILEPLDGTEAPAAVVRVRARVEATAEVQEVRVGAAQAQLVGGDWVAEVGLALGENVVSVVATDANGLSGSASVRVRYRDATLEPLAVTGIDPVPGTSDVEPSALVSISFNKPVLRESLAGRFTLAVAGTPLAGGYQVAPGEQTVSFVARQPLPEGERVDVLVAGVEPAAGPGMAGDYRSQFSVRPRRLVVQGNVLDERLEPIQDVRVAVEGTDLSTATGPEGMWHLFGVDTGAAVLRFEGGVLPDGTALPVVRRRIFVSGTEDTRDQHLVMVPVDRAAVDRVEAGAALHLAFSDRHPGLAIDVPADGLYFEDGKTSGFVTATRIPKWALPVPVDSGRAIFSALWQLAPVGLRATKPVEITFPNLDGLPAGRYALVYAYDPDRHMLERVGVAKVAADGATLRTVGPTGIGGLDFFGYGDVTDAQQAFIESTLNPPAPPPEGTPPEGTTGSRLDPREEDHLPLLARLLLLPTGDRVAHAFWPSSGLGGMPEPEGGMVQVAGRVRSPQEKELEIQVRAGIVAATTVDVPFEHPVVFEARPVPQSDLPIRIAMRAARGQTAVFAPAREDWSPDQPGVGLARVAGTIHLEPGTTLVAVEAQASVDSRTARLEAVLTELPPDPAVIDPATGQPRRRGTLTVRRLVETESSAASGGMSFFRNWPVEVTAGSSGRGVTGDQGQFAVPVYSYGSNQSALACTEVQTGTRWIVQADRTDSEHPKLVRYPITDGFPVCSTLWTLGGSLRLIVDMRALLGSVRLYNRDDRPVELGCDPEDRTEWNAATNELVRIAREEVGETEVYFFREDDLETPIARTVYAVPVAEDACAPGGPHGEYARLRFGPSERWTRRDREDCARLQAAEQTTSDFYRFTCEGRDRILNLRLSEGDHLVVFAVNHATGYSGATTVVVPPITTSQGLEPDGKCKADEEAKPKGPILFSEYGQELSISRCAQQDLRVFANLRLYPPEIDVRVGRKVRGEGASTEKTEHLVRHGGAATTRDDVIHVSTHWRVRLPPEDLDGDGTPNVTDACPNEIGPPETFGCPDPLRPNWTPPPRPLELPVAPPPVPPEGIPGTGGVPWPYQYSGIQPGPAVDPFDADGDGVPDVAYDRDGDGTSDVVDACPLLPGPATSPRPGCPDVPDSDHDGTADGGDECPTVAGPPTSPRPGCPDPSNPGWKPDDADADGVPDVQDLCPFYPGPASAEPTSGCPSLVSRFDTDDDGTADPDDECIWAPGPPTNHGCPDPAQPGWIPDEAPPRIAGGPGKVLEAYCSELRNPTPEQIRVCTRLEARLMDVPAGVPPLAGQLVRVTGSALETPAVAVFPIFPGKGTSNIQAALRIQQAAPTPEDPQAAVTKTINLPRANYYVHAVGNLTLFNDLNGDGRIDPTREIAVAPPAFAEPENPPGGWKPGMPERAVAMKNVYRSLEPDGSVLERFDRDREHEFRVLELALESVTAKQPDGTDRTVNEKVGDTPAHVALDSDLSYQVLMQLLAPHDAGRAGTLPGTYSVRLGTGEYGIDCAVTVGTGTLSATCDGGWLYDVLSARDVVYIGLSLAGNAENVLYRYNLQGLSPRRDLVTAGHQSTTRKSVTADSQDGTPELLRSISEPALANVFFGPTQFRQGTVKVCAGSCNATGLIRSFDLKWLDAGRYEVTAGNGRGVIEQMPNTGLEGAALFRVPIAPQFVQMAGIARIGLSPPPGVFVEWRDTLDPDAQAQKIDLGKAAGVYEGANARAPGQAGVGGVNVADGHLSFRHEDFSLPEYAGRVRFARTFNNQDNEIGTLGIGWRHNLESYVAEESPGRYTMVLEGQSYDFPSCTPIGGQQGAYTCTMGDNSHGGTLTVQERPGSRHVPDVLFQAPNGMRYRFDRYSQKALQFATVVDQYVTASAVQELAEYQAKTSNATPIPAVPPHKLIREAGRRRWILTSWDDGHGRPDPTDATLPGLGHTVLEYFADSDMIRRVYRKGGKVGLYFAYDPVDLDSSVSPRFKAAAVAESFGFLKSVEARFQDAKGEPRNPADPLDFVVRLTFAPDARRNLARVERIASEDRTTVDQAWDYAYVQDLQSIAEPGKVLRGRDLWEATNEIERAELKVLGQIQWRTTWSRTRTWEGYPHTKKFEIVDQMVLPGTSTITGGPEPQRSDVPTRVEWLSANARRIHRADGVQVDVDLNHYGSVSVESVAGSSLSTSWFNDVSQGGEASKVQPNARTAATGRRLAFGSTDDGRMRPTALTLAAVGSDQKLAAGVAANTTLRNHLQHDPRFGTPESTTRATAQGTASWSTPVDDATGDPRSLQVAEGEETLTSWTADGEKPYDDEGRLLSETDAAGRKTVHVYPDENPWGLGEQSTTTLASPAQGARGSVVRSREYDWLGRVTREFDDAGHEEQWTYDALGRITRHSVRGTPSEEWTWEYTESELELRVTEKLNGVETRERHYRDGLLVSESWPYAPAPATTETATRSFTYLGGRLDVSSDERGIERRHHYDERGRLERVEATDRRDPANVVVADEVRYTRDDEGKVLTETDQNGLVVTTAYDVLGRAAEWDYGPASADGSVGDVETVKRDPNGVTSERVHGSFTWTSRVDGLGRVRSVEASGRLDELRTTTDYDGLGRKVRSEDHVLGLVETWKYEDVLGRQTSYTRTAAPYEDAYQEVRRYADTVTGETTEHTVEIEESIGSTTIKRRKLWLDDLGRTLRVQEHVRRGGQDLAADRYFEYDARGNVTWTREPVGDGPTGSTATATSATTAVSSRTYDAVGNLLTETDPKGTVTSYHRDAAGNVERQLGPHPQEAWTFQYDAFGQLKVKALDGPPDGSAAGWKGATWTYAYKLASGATVSETDPLHYVTERWFNARQKLVKEVRRDAGPGAPRSSSNEQRVEITYDGPWVVRHVTREGASSTTIERRASNGGAGYDHRGRVLREVEQFQGPEADARYTYTTEIPWSGRVASPMVQSWANLPGAASGSRTGRREVDALENVTLQAWGAYADSFTYDAAGRLGREARSGRPVATYAYEEGLLVEVVVASSNGLDIETTATEFWASGRPRRTVTPDGRERRLEWDARGQLRLEEYGRGSDVDVKEYGYDAAGNLSSMKRGTGADLSEWAYASGPRGELWSVTQPGGAGEFRYAYDARGALAAITPPAGGSAGQGFQYDYLGRQVQRTRGGASWTTSWADGAATELEPFDARFGDQRTTRRVLDGRGRPLVTSYTGVAGSDLTGLLAEHDPLDQPLRVTERRVSGDVVTSYGYEADRPLLTGIARGGETVSYGRTASGEVDWLQTPAGQVDYGYDGFDRLETIGAGTRTTTLTWEDGGARLVEMADDLGSARECRRYDDRGRLTLVASVVPGEDCDYTPSPLARYAYGYDQRGNRLGETYEEGQKPIETTAYGYDAADRLTGVRYPTGTARLYELGGDGSRLGEKEVPSYGGSLGPLGYQTALGAEERYGYDGQGGLTSITAGDGTVVASYTVDLAGRVRVEARGTNRREYGWDGAGRLVTATVRHGVGTPEATSATFAYRYDHSGRRVRKSGPSGEWRYLWGAGDLVQETVPDGTRLVYERMGDLVAGVTAYGGSGAMIGRERFLHDGLGSVVGRVRSDGTTSLHRYDAWGSFRGEGPAAGEASLAYAGQHWDADVGLSYAQQRWYEPGTGRFLSEDPVFGQPGRPETLHAFGYGGANPLLYTDPDGRFINPDQIRRDLLWGYSLLRPRLSPENQKRLDALALGTVAAQGMARQGLAVAQQKTNAAIEDAAYTVWGGSTLGNVKASADSAGATFVTDVLFGTANLLVSPEMAAHDFVEGHKQAVESVQVAADSSVPTRQRVEAGAFAAKVFFTDILLATSLKGGGGSPPMSRAAPRAVGQLELGFMEGMPRQVRPAPTPWESVSPAPAKPPPELGSWLAKMKTKPARTRTAADRFQLEQAGPTEFRVEGGGESVWADSVEASTLSLVETKHVGKPGRSPFVRGSDAPRFVRDAVLKELNDEFRRYGCVINDPCTPVTNLKVRTNNEAAADLLRTLMEEHSVPGDVTVFPGPSHPSRPR